MSRFRLERFRPVRLKLLLEAHRELRRVAKDPRHYSDIVVPAARTLPPVAPDDTGVVATDGNPARRMAAEVAWSVSRAAGLSRAYTCLVRAVAASRLLQARGISSNVVVGTDSTALSSFQAHAWLEINGEPVLGFEAGKRYAVFGALTCPALHAGVQPKITSPT